MSKMKLFICTFATLLTILTTASKCQAQVTAKFSGGTLSLVVVGTDYVQMSGLGPGRVVTFFDGETLEWQGVKHIKVQTKHDFLTLNCFSLEITGNLSCVCRLCLFDGGNVQGNLSIKGAEETEILNTHVGKNLTVEHRFPPTFNPFFVNLAVINCTVNGNAKVVGTDSGETIRVTSSYFGGNLSVDLRKEGLRMYVGDNFVAGNMTLAGAGDLIVTPTPSVVQGRTKFRGNIQIN